MGLKLKSVLKLQSVHKAMARMLIAVVHRDHVTLVLFLLFWLPVCFCVQALVLVLGPAYLKNCPAYLKYCKGQVQMYLLFTVIFKAVLCFQSLLQVKPDGW